MSCASGNLGKVLVGAVEVAQVISWNATVTTQQTKRTTSSTAPWPSRCKGNKDVTGQVVIQADDEGLLPAAFIDALTSGDQITLQLQTDGTNEWTGPAKIEQASQTVDIDGGEDQQGTFNFGADGAWTIPKITP